MVKGGAGVGLDSFKPHPTVADLFSFVVTMFSSKFLFISTKNSIFDFYIYARDLVPVMFLFKFNQLLQYKTLVDISVVDNSFKLNRFKLIYSLLSYNFAQRINIHTFVKEADFVVSIRGVFKSAN
jgi:NADH:ubiquinone oxidoreductase subunit C